MAVDFDALVLAPCIDAFGSTVTYARPGRTQFQIQGVLDKYHVEVSFDEQGAAVSTRRPILGLRESSFPAGVCAEQGDTVTSDGVTYEIVDTQPDGHGHVLLILKFA